MWKTRHNTADLGCFKIQTFAGDLEDSKFTSRGVFRIFGSRTFVPVSRMCKETNISFSQRHRVWNYFSGCRWDIVIEVLRTTKDNIQPGHTSSGKIGQDPHPTILGSGKLEYAQPNWTICDSKTKTQHVNRKQGVEQLKEVDHVPHQHTFFSRGISVTHLWRQRSCDQDDNERDEVPQWDMCRELTESLLIGYLIGSTWNPKSISNMLIPRSNLLTL